MRFATLMLVLVGCFSVGCSNNRNGAGTVDMGLQIDLGDRDSETPTEDMGSTPTDLGTSTDMGSASCGPVPAPTAPTMGVQCTSATLSCLMACTTAECQQNCVTMDDFTGDGTPDANCLTCINQYGVTCAYGQGCNDEYDTANCCAAEHCSLTPTTECIQMNCLTEQNAFISCVNTVLAARPACSQDALACFPSS